MTSHSRLFDDDPRVAEATHWLLRLSDEAATGEDVAEWQKWLGAAPEHRTAFERAQAVWQLSAQIDRVPWPTDREVAEDAYDASVPVAQALRSAKAPRRSFRPLALAASVAALAIVAGTLWYSKRTVTLLTTHIGESRSVALADGSRVTLGGASSLRLSMDDKTRALALESGEAFFEVAKDPARPFVVRAGDVRVTAIGTAFNVRRAADRVQVAVTDGAVKVMETQVTAGRQALVTQGAVSAPTATEIQVVLARRSGRLQYTSEPLRYVVADLSRYSRLPIRIQDESAADLLITGTVLESDVKGWMQGLEKALPVRVTFTDEHVEIATRPR